MGKNVMNFVSVLTIFLGFNLVLLASEENVDNRIPVDELDNCSFTKHCITEPGHYYLRDNIVVSGIYDDGIRIESDNVTLDLNGYAIISGSSDAYNGIRVKCCHNNIVIKNGEITGFSNDGIRAEVADGSSFINLKLKDNGGDGLNVGNNCLVVDCIATNNENNGIEGTDNVIIRDCTASQNGRDGIEVWDASTVYNCTSFDNVDNGIEAKNGCRVEGCTAYQNGEFGIEFTKSGLCLRNTAHRNGEHGIYGFENLFAMNNVSNENGVCITNSTCGNGSQGVNLNEGAGIRTFRNSIIINNECIGNYFGIAVSQDDSTISNNTIQKNKHAGIIAIESGNIILSNKAEGNGFLQSPSVSDTEDYPLGNIVFGPGDFANSSIGPIVDVSTIGDISTLSGSDHPFANFIY